MNKIMHFACYFSSSIRFFSILKKTDFHKRIKVTNSNVFWLFSLVCWDETMSYPLGNQMTPVDYIASWKYRAMYKTKL